MLLNTENMLWLVSGWLLIQGTYFIVKSILTKFFSSDSKTIETGIVVWVGIFVYVGLHIVSFIPQSRFFKRPFFENPPWITNIQQLDTLIPMCCASAIAIYVSWKNHHDKIRASKKPYNRITV